MRPVPEIDQEMEARVRALGFDLVDVRWGGSARRPQLRIRIDRLDTAAGEGVTVDDCATVSRGLEPWLDACGGLPEKYVLEVSSPGVDRPLIHARDFRRFRGERVAIKGRDILVGRARRLEGELLGLEGEGEGGAVRLRLQDGDEVSVPREQIAGANLVFTWK